MNPFIVADPGIELAVRLRLACEAHEAELGSHLSNVSRCTVELARHIGLPEETLRLLHFAAPLHDLGKIGIPLEVLRRPGPLTDEEMDTVKEHTLVGYRILDGSPWPVIQCAARIALSHHEAWDGSGYPHGLAGEDIPLEARLCTIADIYDALRSRRCYKSPWPEMAVIEELRRLSGTKFEPRLLDAFLELIPQLEVSAA
ncbi:MAG: HD-GYP domain-containing protein [Opitutaceae bacterium]